MGRTCEEDVDECQEKQCENGAICNNTFGSFICSCPPGFTGTYIYLLTFMLSKWPVNICSDPPY